MPVPVITSRPEKTVNSVLSRWNAANLPLIYDLTNTKWPVNSEDAAANITSVTDDGGFAKINLDASLSLSADDWVLVDGTTPYDGVHQIRSVSGNNLTINTRFTVTATGTAQEYYQNYRTDIRVFAGINPAHEFAATKPIVLIGTIQQRPDTDNITRVDVREYVKNKLNTDYNVDQLSWPNDLNGWTDFYISIGERYDGQAAGAASNFDDDTDIDGIIYLKATHAAQQFGYEFGGNMGEYLIDDNPYSSQAKWLTFFERSKLIDFNSFNLSIISELTPFDLNICQFDVNGARIAIDFITIADQDYGVYRLPLDINFIEGASHLTIQASVGGFNVSVIHTIDIDPGCVPSPQDEPVIVIPGIFIHGSSIIFQVTISANQNAGFVINSTRTMNFWPRTGGGDCQIFQIDNDGLITALGSPVEFDSSEGTHNSSFLIDSTHVMNFYAGFSSDGFARIFSINPTTGSITALDSPFEFDTVLALFNSSFLVDSTHVINFWSGFGLDGFCQMFLINTTTGVTTALDSPLEFDTDSGQHNSAFLIDSTHIMNFWQGTAADGFCQIFEINTGTGVITPLDSPLEFDTNNNEFNSAFLIDATHVMNFWTGDAGDGFCQIFSINPTTGSITALDSPFEFDTLGANYNSSYLVNSTNVVNAWQDSTGIGVTQLFSINVSTGVVETTGDQITFDGTNSLFNSHFLVSSTRSMGFWDGAGGNGVSRVFKITAG